MASYARPLSPYETIMTAPHPTATASSTGLQPNVAGALAYLLGPLTGIAFYVLEKENRFVRFHAAQSIVIGIAMVALSIAFSVLGGVLAFIPVLGWIVALLLSLVLGFGSLALWLFLMWQAFQGKEWEAPAVGAYARRMI